MFFILVVKYVSNCNFSDQNPAKSPSEPDTAQLVGQTADQASPGHFLSAGGRTQTEKADMMLKTYFFSEN